MRDFSQDVYESMSDLIESSINENVHTSTPGEIRGIEENHTASFKPSSKIVTDDGEEIPYPQISGATVLMPCGAGGTVGFSFPVKEKDLCVAIYGEGGNGSEGKFDLSNAFILPGLCNSSPEQVKKAGDSDAAIVFAPGSTIVVSKDFIEIKRNGTVLKLTDDSLHAENGGASVSISSSNVSITASETSVSGNVSVVGDVSISGTLTVGGIAFNTHTHTSPSGETGGPH